MRILAVMALAMPVLAACGAGRTDGSISFDGKGDPTRIQGPSAPCFGSTSEYRFCPRSNFPYHWRWSVTGADASVVNRGTPGNCYVADVSVGASPVTLTFHQRNPDGVPQVHDVTKHIGPKQCQKGE